MISKFNVQEGKIYYAILLAWTFEKGEHQIGSAKIHKRGDSPEIEIDSKYWIF